MWVNLDKINKPRKEHRQNILTIDFQVLGAEYFGFFHFEMLILFSTAILMLYNINQKDKIGVKSFNCSEEKIIYFSFVWEDSRVLGFLVSVEGGVKC